MKNLLREFGPKDTCRWFEEHGVPLVAQADDCVFPAAQDSAAIVGCLVVQDVIMSRIRLFGATTDLAVCAIILITILEGTEVGTVFVLIASTCYYFSGSAPGAYVIALLTFLSTGAGMLRQLYWHRSRGSILLFSGITIVLYELGLFVVGVTNGLTIATHLGAFLLTGFYSVLAMIPLYSLVYKIGLIGGNTWKE